MQKNTFTVDNHQLYYITAGSPQNPPIIMIHGYTSSHHVWRTTIPALENDYYCVALDLLGHGESDLTAQGDYTIAAQGKRVLALADKLGFEHFSLIGHSMGGQISLYIAAMLAPQRVDKLVNVAGVVTAKLTPFVETTVFQPIKQLYGTPFAYLAEVYTRIFSVRWKFAAERQFASWWYDFNAREFDWWRVDRVFANRAGMRHVWFHGMNAIQGLDLTAHLPKIQARTMVIFGAEDNVVPVTDGHLVDTLVPDSRLHLFEQCGHFPMYECEGKYIGVICDFLLDNTGNV
jgi:pimeloyl-ACP methyl ester carboxylesterase